MKGFRIGLHVIAVAVMLLCAVMVILDAHAVRMLPANMWFLQHWPYHDQGWATVFLCASAVGSLGFWVKTHISRVICATILGSGHVTIAHAIWSTNDINLAVMPYLAVAMGSVVVIVLTVLED